MPASTGAVPSVSPVSPAIGAEVAGIDLAAPIADDQVRTLRALLLEHEVLFFRAQQLTPAQLVALARRFGQPQAAAESSFAKFAAFPEIDVLEFDRDHPPHNTRELWHTDFSGREQPTLGSLLYAVDVPAVGGDTVWVSLSAAWAGLSAPLQHYLEGMQAEHHTWKGFGDDIRQALWQTDAGRRRRAELVDLPPVLHPVVRRHPESGRPALFVNEGFTTRLAGIPRAESDAILGYLFQHSLKPEYQCRLRWAPGTLAIWDNRSTKHYALADYTEHRLHYRITLQGDRPR
ncbi:MAG: TauD/TfdA family dioxygenase [Pseudomonadota bacterium]